MFGDRISPRRLLWLCSQLPEDSATVIALRGGEEWRGWGTAEQLLATLIDAVQWNTYATIAVNSKKPPRKPAPVPRPGDMKRRVMTVSDIIAAERRRRHGGN